jgi:glycine cleavage system pyridoxal-binding protein P
MLKLLGFESLDELVDATVPEVRKGGGVGRDGGFF